MRNTAAKFQSITEFKPDPAFYISRRPETKAERAAYARIEAGARNAATWLIKDGARKYMRCPFYLNAIEAELTKRTPRVMLIRLRTLWNERRVQPLNYRSAVLYVRLLRARDNAYLRKHGVAL